MVCHASVLTGSFGSDVSRCIRDLAGRLFGSKRHVRKSLSLVACVIWRENVCLCRNNARFLWKRIPEKLKKVKLINYLLRCWIYEHNYLNVDLKILE